MKPAGKGGARVTEGPIGKTVFSLMLPMALGMSAIVVNNVAGAFFIARVSTDQLAAISRVCQPGTAPATRERVASGRWRS